MNEDFDIKAQLSALVDGELEEFEVRQLLKRLDAMPQSERDQAYAVWQRYQLMSQHLNTADNSLSAGDDFLAKVSSAMDKLEVDDVSLLDVPLSVAPVAASQMAVGEAHAVGTANNPAWAKFAVAASVALAVIVGVQQYQISDHRESLRIAQENAATSSRRVSPVYNAGAQLAGLKQTTRQGGSVDSVIEPSAADPATQVLQQQQMQQQQLQQQPQP